MTGSGMPAGRTDLLALLNGHVCAGVPVADRGLHYGDGIFRTLRVLAGEPQAWTAHWQRLAHDCARLDMTVPEQTLLRDECAQLFADGGHGVLKILITRAAAGRGYTPPAQTQPNRLLLRYPAGAQSANRALRIGVCRLRLGRNPHLAGVKHLNRLEQVLARAECQRADWPEALLLDSEGWVISGTMSNLFLVKDQRLLTPLLDQAGVIGATRQQLLTAAVDAGLACEENNFEISDCMAADELFLCNSLMGVCPVQRLETTEFATGEITRWCQQQIATG